MKYKYNGEWVDINIKALDSMPIGAIILFSGNTIPTGWLICDGSTLNEEEYPELYDVIGHIYGGTGLDFNVPDFKGRTAVGRDGLQTEFANIGQTGGSKELQAHNHKIGIAQNVSTGGSYGLDSTSSTYMDTGITGTGNSGNLQPYLVVRYIIKAFNTTPTMASIVDTYSTSTQDGYSCDYVNNMIVSNYDSTNKTGYVKYPDGTAICYGLYNSVNGIGVPAGSGTSVEITLPITMKDTNYTSIISKYSGGNGYSFVMDNVIISSTSKFIINLWNNNGSGTCYVMGYYWQVVGRWK